MKERDKGTGANTRFAQLPGSVSSLPFGFIIYICHGEHFTTGQPCHASHLARLPIPATVQTQTLAPMPLKKS